MSTCHSTNKENKYKQGLFYGLIPHVFCFLFIFLSIMGATTATILVKNLLLIPYLFTSLIILSFGLATVSALFYLKKCDCLTPKKIKTKWKYLTTLYTSTIITNLIIFYVVFPLSANLQTIGIVENQNNQTTIELVVDIPCSGHAFIIINEIKRNIEVNFVRYQLPETFIVSFDPTKTSKEAIISLEIFNSFNIKNN